VKNSRTPRSEKTPKVETSLPVAELPKRTVTHLASPPPDVLEEAALAEPDYLKLGEYSGVISILRGKGFSFRQIAGWLSGRGVDADHNSVYRVYSKGLTHDEQQELCREEAEEQESRNG